VIDPIVAIQAVRRRLARLAAMQTLTPLLPPLIVVAGTAWGLRALGEDSWELHGFDLAGNVAQHLQIGLLCAAALGCVAAGVAAYFSFRRGKDPLAAAEQIDRRLGTRQEVLTLVTLKDVERPARSPLFPLLWRRAAAHLERLDPVRAFPFQIRPVLRRAAILTVATVVLLAGSISVLVAANETPLSAPGRQLRRIAREIANSNPTDAQTRELVAHLRAVANTLDNPGLPPQTKLEQLAKVEQEVKAQQRREQQQRAAGKGNAASGNGNGKGSQGQGTGEAKGNAGQGKEGTGSGPGKGAGTGTGGGGPNKGGKGEVQLAQARKDISKVQAQLEAEAKQKSGEQEAKGGLHARSPRPGEQPNLATIASARNSPNLNGIKPNQKGGQDQSNQQGEEPAQLQRKDYGSSQGDTHLGQFPRPGNFERFYKLGEHGAPLDVKNARYVLFRIPTAVVGAGGGKSVTDNDRRTASVPYANLPLKDERIAAEPDERQLVPPRYRDLLR
jgi:hypothetical protein